MTVADGKTDGTESSGAGQSDGTGNVDAMRDQILRLQKTTEELTRGRNHLEQRFNTLDSQLANRPAPATLVTLGPDQQRVVLSYRLIRNGLGNYGGNGDGYDRALVRMLQRVRNEIVYLLEIPQFPTGAAKVKIHAAGTPTPVERAAASSINLTGLNIKRVDLVEVLDASDSPIAAGIPSVTA